MTNEEIENILIKIKYPIQGVATIIDYNQLQAFTQEVQRIAYLNGAKECSLLQDEPIMVAMNDLDDISEERYKMLNRCTDRLIQLAKELEK